MLPGLSAGPECYNFCRAGMALPPFGSRGPFFHPPQELMGEMRGISCTIIPSIPLSLPIQLPLQPPHQDKAKLNLKDKKIEEKKIWSWKFQCATKGHMVYHLVHITLLTNIGCNESLVCFKASGFCYTVDTGLSMGVPLSYPLVVLCHLKLWICRVWPFTWSRRS